MKMTPYMPIVRVVKLRRVCGLHTAHRARRRKTTQNVDNFKERNNLGHLIVAGKIVLKFVAVK
jgi:hypothetical protein